jgi:hypothetical protein
VPEYLEKQRLSFFIPMIVEIETIIHYMGDTANAENGRLVQAYKRKELSVF